jgi:hypothetical protein
MTSFWVFESPCSRVSVLAERQERRNALHVSAILVLLRQPCFPLCLPRERCEENGKFHFHTELTCSELLEMIGGKSLLLTTSGNGGLSSVEFLASTWT